MNIFYRAQQLCIRHLISSQRFSYFIPFSQFIAYARASAYGTKMPHNRSQHLVEKWPAEHFLLHWFFCVASSWIILFTQLSMSHFFPSSGSQNLYTTKYKIPFDWKLGIFKGKKNEWNCAKKICQSFTESMYSSAVGASKMAIIRINLSRLTPPSPLGPLLLPLVM